MNIDSVTFSDINFELSLERSNYKTFNDGRTLIFIDGLTIGNYTDMRYQRGAGTI